MKNISVEKFVTSDTPDGVIKEYFESDKKAMHQWLYANYQGILDARVKIEPGERKKWVWSGIEYGIPNIGSIEFIEVVTPSIDKLRLADSRESFNKLRRLKAWLMSECEYSKVKNRDALDPWSANYYEGKKYVDFAILGWDGKKYLVWIEEIYNQLIDKIDILLRYYESAFPEWFHIHGSEDGGDLSLNSNRTSEVSKNTNNQPGAPDITDQGASQGQPTQKTLSVKQIALKYFYEGVQITNDNAQSIAETHYKTSKKNLLDTYNKFTSKANRRGKPHPPTPKRFENKIGLLNSVLEILPDDKKHAAIDDIKALKDAQKREFE